MFALLVPFWIGVTSDRMPYRLAALFGRRMLILLLTAPVLALSVAAAPFMRTYWLMAGAAFISFAALQSYLTPLWALMLDSVPDERRGRVQGIRGMLRAAGLAYGLVAAGLLFSIARPMPFLVAAALVLVTTGATWIAERKVGGDREPHRREHVGLRHTWRRLARRPAAMWLLLANALWNGGIDGIRPYVFLYATTVLRISVAQAALRLGILVVGMGIGSAIIGRLGDAFPRGRLLEIGVAVLALAFSSATFVRGLPLVDIVLGVAGLGAAGAVTIGYPYFAGLVGEERQGEYTGLWVFSVGLGRIVAPMLVGLAIDIGARLMPETQGYPMMWAAASVLAAGGWLCVRHTIRIAARPERANDAAQNRVA